jgi:hypothetical protein
MDLMHSVLTIAHDQVFCVHSGSQPGLSWSLGSSRCVPCSKIQYKGYVPVVLIALIAGIFLISFSIMILNLTVDSETLNGLIFSVNIIGANSSPFFFGISPSIRYYSILASWFNLEMWGLMIVNWWNGRILENIALVGFPNVHHESSCPCHHY